MLNYFRTFLLIIVSVHAVKTFDASNVVFIIVSQSEPYHASVASRLKTDIVNQVHELGQGEAIVHLTHEDFLVPGAWTITPLLPHLLAKYKSGNVRWILFLEPHTAVSCEKLFKSLEAADKKKAIKWIGYPLSDVEPTIIHHFKYFDELEDVGGFVYPNFASGFAMKMKFIESIVNKIEDGTAEVGPNVSIDPAYELALLIYGRQEKHGPFLTRDLSFCVVSSENCATYPRQFDTCGIVPEKSIYFAVKTWSGFHSTRARIVKKTWGRHVTNLHFFSDIHDSSLPATATGIPNVKSGHCMKTMAIIKDVLRSVQKMPHIKWIFLADDDTILGVKRLCEVLSCYRGGDDVTVLGERYGYGYAKKSGPGYDYITGGGGIALSVGAAKVLSQCMCPSLTSPDDMTLGACATQSLNVPLTHSPLFHQTRPQDYPREVLARDRPVSFHRHSMPDPLKVYASWFEHDDLSLHIRDEL